MSNIEPIIIPTVGRVVWFYPAPKSGEAGFVCNESGGPYAAIVARVWNDRMVNLAVIDANGTLHSRTSVRLVQGDEPAPDSAFCGWMPFQKGQAAKQDTQFKEVSSGPRIRSHRDELEQSAAHALAARVAEIGSNGANLGNEVRKALDALMNDGAKDTQTVGDTHASRTLYPAIRNAMEELAALHPDFNDHVNRAWNYLHSAFWSEAPAPASAPGLRVTLASEGKPVRLPVRDDHRDEPAPRRWSFDDLVEYGRLTSEVQGENRMPWSFTLEGHPVTHENDDLYLISLPDRTLRFRRGDMLESQASGSLRVIRFASGIEVPDLSTIGEALLGAGTVAAGADFAPPHCDFGDAIRHLKAGRRVARAGWNGKGMWLALSCDGSREVPAANFWAPANRAWAEEQPNGTATVLPSITMKTATGEILMGWLASQTDMLAADWVVVD